MVPSVHDAPVPVSLAAMMLLAAGYGLVHALDADHVAAVTVFVSKRPSPLRAMGVAIRWGIGHGATLLVLGVAAVVLGMALPPELEKFAEIAVGLTLMALGGYALVSFVRRRIHLHAHAHERDEARHLHLHAHGGDEGAASHRHAHSPTLVGLVHGAAGSAGAFVLIPVAAKASPAVSLAYLVVFSLSILFAMVVIAFAASRLYDQILVRRRALFEAARAVTGLASLSLGAFWVASEVFAR